MSFKKVFLMYC